MIDVIALSMVCCPEVAPQTMAAIVTYESRGNPFAIHLNGPAHLSRQPATAEEAIEVARRLERAGWSFDAGLGMLNNTTIRHLRASWVEVFTPCRNLQLAARVLIPCYLHAGSESGEQDRIARALSCYNTGTYTLGFDNGYVGRVYQAAPHTRPQRNGERAAQQLREFPN